MLEKKKDTCQKEKFIAINVCIARKEYAEKKKDSCYCILKGMNDWWILGVESKGEDTGKWKGNENVYTDIWNWKKKEKKKGIIEGTE